MDISELLLPFTGVMLISALLVALTFHPALIAVALISFVATVVTLTISLLSS